PAHPADPRQPLPPDQGPPRKSATSHPGQQLQVVPSPSGPNVPTSTDLADFAAPGPAVRAGRLQEAVHGGRADLAHTGCARSWKHVVVKHVRVRLPRVRAAISRQVIQPALAQHRGPRLGVDLRLAWRTSVAKRELEGPFRRGSSRSEFGELAGYAVEVPELRPARGSAALCPPRIQF